MAQLQSAILLTDYNIMTISEDVRSEVQTEHIHTADSDDGSEKETIAKKSIKQCKACGLKVESLIAHRMQSKQCWYKCSKCDYKNIYQSKIESHTKRVHSMEDKLYICTKCNRNFKYNTNLNRHINICHNNGSIEGSMVKCDICKKSFTSKSSLEYHIRVHSKSQQSRCPHCELVLSNYTAKFKHVRECHADEHKTVDKESREHIVLKGHNTGSRLRDVIENRQLCDICGQMMKRGARFKRHLKTHTCRRFNCDHCTFSTPLFDCLSIHKQTHSNLK